MFRHKSADLLLVIILTIFTTLLTYSGYGNSTFRTIIALPFVLFLPGYTALAAINPRAAMGRPELMMLSIGLSLSLTALWGLFLNWTPAGLHPQSWSIALGATTLIASLIGVSRRREILPTPSKPFSIGLDFTQQLVLGLAVVVAVAAFIIARQGALQQQTTPFTQLWLLPPEESAPSTVQIGILNQEKETITYRLQLISEPLLLEQWREIELEPGQTWETTFALPADLDRSKPVKAVLYQQAAPREVYRETLIWLNQAP